MIFTLSTPIIQEYLGAHFMLKPKWKIYTTINQVPNLWSPLITSVEYECECEDDNKYVFLLAIKYGDVIPTEYILTYAF